MECIMFSIFPSSYCYYGTSCTTKQTSSHKQLRTFFFSNQYARREFVFTRQSSRNYELRSLIINGQIQNGATGETSRNKRFMMEGLHQDGDILAGKYKITGILGQGGSSITYEAEVGDGEKVALKAMSLRNMRGWKELDLFERECRVLQSLQHPSIPQYIDYFEVDTDRDRVFYIVQKIASGKSLADLVQSGWHVSEKEIKEVTIKVLDILRYLGDLRPPVIHRDIKPENIIWDTSTRRISLVDFGAVQDAVSITMIGSTVVGTYGYMAPEQFQNRATLQTDLYGLGCTILYILSGRSPSSFPQKRLKIDFKGLVPMSSHFANIVERLLEPAPEDRFQSADEVIEALMSEDGFLNKAASKNSNMRELRNRKISQPAGTKVLLTRTSSQLKISIPPGGVTAETAGTGTFAVAWNAFIAFWTGSAIRMGAPLFFTLFSLPFWFVGIRLAKRTVSSLVIGADLNFGSKKFSITWKLGNLWSYRVDGQTKDIISVGLIIEAEQNGQPITAACVKEGVNSHTFGASLELIEKKWLVHEINDFLGLSPLQQDSFPRV
ncbi:uncharacterized protein LOC131034044 isoform X1 [Cryptomeria japonica]|uniref:uncharacterized protein LOC131034044 isoform X1 n=2 Tax=Cryptomeria japonica TaxID=3369 RepID=UPI0027DA15B5|nr:uncharacterized protein LOC131034044 isoform X1 [Cryptomeria japonica]